MASGVPLPLNPPTPHPFTNLFRQQGGCCQRWEGGGGGGAVAERGGRGGGNKGGLLPRSVRHLVCLQQAHSQK